MFKGVNQETAQTRTATRSASTVIAIVCLVLFAAGCASTSPDVKKVRTKSSEKDILLYYFSRPVYSIGDICEKLNLITIDCPFHIPSDAIFPIIKVSPGATVSPKSLEQVDINHAIYYTVVAEDGSSKIYKVVYVGVPAIPSPGDISDTEKPQAMEGLKVQRR